MAYIDLNEVGQLTTTRLASRSESMPQARPTGSDTLTELEWSVVTIARNDRRSSLRPPGRLTTALRALFNQTNPMLADGRLEALRRMAVLTWHHGYVVPSREVRAFLEAGFTADQYETMVNSVTATRVPPRTART